MSCYVIILNYNGWKDTVECLDSVFQTEHINYKVIVCDNKSYDNSINNIKSWLDGKLDIREICRNTLLKTHLKKKPSYIYWDKPLKDSYDSPLLLVENRENRGFAAGNNIGINIAMNQNDCDCLFILNNDTVITPSTIYEGTQLFNKPNIGIVSTLVKYYNDPSKLAWRKTYYNPETGYEYPVLKTHTVSNKYLYKYTGMAFFVSKEFVKTIGLMNEKYFLYFEELDWSIRSKNKYQQAFAQSSIVYHKEASSVSYESPLSQFCTLRSRFLFIKKYYPNKLIKIYFRWYLKAIKEIFLGHFSYGYQILSFLIIFPFKGEQYTAGYFDYLEK